jgi:peptidoglycan hydrolase-like protein with peptidoglycan-binding domain
VRQVLARVREEVLKETTDRQVPWDSSSLRGEFYFNPRAAVHSLDATIEPQAIPNINPQNPGSSPDIFDLRQADLSFWNAIVASRKAADFDAYLQAFPSGIFAGLARSRLEDLRPSASVAAEPKTPSANSEPLPRLQRPIGAPQASGEPSTVIAALPTDSAEPIPANVEQAIGLSRDDWRQLQQALSALGFDTRGVDGKPGPVTRRAVADWQRARRVDVTGFLGRLQRELILAEARAVTASEPRTATYALRQQEPTPSNPSPSVTPPVLTTTTSSKEISFTIRNRSDETIDNLRVTDKLDHTKVYARSESAMKIGYDERFETRVPVSDCIFAVHYRYVETASYQMVTRNLCAPILTVIR